MGIRTSRAATSGADAKSSSSAVTRPVHRPSAANKHFRVLTHAPKDSSLTTTSRSGPATDSPGLRSSRCPHRELQISYPDPNRKDAVDLNARLLERPVTLVRLKYQLLVPCLTVSCPQSKRAGSVPDWNSHFHLVVGNCTSLSRDRAGHASPAAGAVSGNRGQIPEWKKACGALRPQAFFSIKLHSRPNLE